MEASSKEKARVLLHIIGAEEKLAHLELQEQELYNRRHAIGQIADQKSKFMKEMPYFTDTPKELISVLELIQQQQEILARNRREPAQKEKIFETSGVPGGKS